jgi:hypothetical protein
MPALNGAVLRTVAATVIDHRHARLHGCAVSADVSV